jgi:hypothetical protein
MMKPTLKFLALTCALLCNFVASAFGQNPSGDLGAKVDAIVTVAYQAALEQFPCKLGAHGKAKMLSWQAVDKCLNYANDRVNWEELSLQIQKIRESGGYQTMDVFAAVQSSLTAHAIPYNKVFRVKETEALLPLSNSLLKFLPADSLTDLPVFNNSGVRIGTFSGVYVFEKRGALSGNMQRHPLFQYTDSSGRMQSAPDRLLLDSYGVPWKDAQTQIGFRLPADKLTPKR